MSFGTLQYNTSTHPFFILTFCNSHNLKTKRSSLFHFSGTPFYLFFLFFFLLLGDCCCYHLIWRLNFERVIDMIYLLDSSVTSLHWCVFFFWWVWGYNWSSRWFAANNQFGQAGWCSWLYFLLWCITFLLFSFFLFCFWRGWMLAVM